MEINTLNFAGNGAFRPYTLSAAIYEVLKNIAPGDSVCIDRAVDIEGKEIGISSLRAGINNVVRVAMKNHSFSTRSKGQGYPLRVIRVR